ncbi:sensor histidine kinase [Nonomuraea rubra]|uniref:sensor histidine kinase n=1 Tax=Nonomuraea rubra TaxID=46180 RepID=UPI0033EC7FEF
MRRTLPRRWACLVLGGALLMPYMMVGVLISGLVHGESANLLLPAQVGVFAAVLPVVAVTGLFLPVRGLSVNAAQGLLGARVETPPRQAGRSWQERRRTAAWFTLHLAVGGVVSGFTLAIVPFTMFTLVLPVTGRSTPVLGFLVTPGWNAVAWAAGGLALLAALVAMAAGAGELLARLAPVLLGPTPAERLAAAEEHARTLAERNRLARELHDSVGHALSVVTLQAAAAARVLDRDPATARTALAAIEQSARTALEDLDHVLGVLRDDRDDRTNRGDRDGHDRSRADGGWADGGRDRSGDGSGRSHDSPEIAGRVSADDADRADNADRADRDGRTDRADRAALAPQATLADLDALVAASGAPVRQEVGDLAGVPAVVSREAYRILQEALTNAIKHGTGPVRLTAAVEGDDLRLEVANGGPRGTGDRTGSREARARGRERTRAGGRGVAGMHERVRLLRGELEAGPTDTGWRVSARLPLRSSP